MTAMSDPNMRNLRKNVFTDDQNFSITVVLLITRQR